MTGSEAMKLVKERKRKAAGKKTGDAVNAPPAEET
jgi:hypothetical protein